MSWEIPWKELVDRPALLIRSCCTLESGVINNITLQICCMGVGSHGIACNMGYQFRTYDSDLQVAV